MNPKPQHYRAGFSYSRLQIFARKMRYKPTKAEAIVRKQFRNRKYRGLKFRRQHQIGLYIADFSCDELKLIIELDGAIHSMEDQQEIDNYRTLFLQDNGFTVIRIKNREIGPGGRNVKKILNNLSRT